MAIESKSQDSPGGLVQPQTPPSYDESTDAPASWQESGPSEATATGETDGGPPRLLEIVSRAVPRDPYLWITVILVIATTAVLSWIQIQAYQSFYFNNGDLGNYNQALYTTAYYGKFFYYTINLPAGTNGSIFAAHFSPFLLLLVPFYALWPTPAGLLVIKQLSLALGAIPLFKLAQLKLSSSRWAALISAVYLLSPITILSATVTGFDPEVFIPALVLAALYFAEVKRPALFFAFWILALSTIEAEGLLLALFGAAWTLGALNLSEVRRFKFGSLRSLPAYATLVAVGWTIMSFVVLKFTGPRGGSFGIGYGNRFTVLGATSILDIPLQVITHPAAASAALQFDGGTKILYAVLVLGSVGFLVLVGLKRFILPVVAWLFFISLSNSNVGTAGMYYFGSQYPCYVVPFLFAGLVTGLVWLGVSNPRRATDPTSRVSNGSRLRRSLIRFSQSSHARARGWSVGFAVILVIALIATSAGPGDVYGRDGAGADAVAFQVMSPTSHEVGLQQVIDLIPPEASVFVTPHIYPHVSGRVDAYSVNLGELFVPPWTFQHTVDTFLNDSTYVVLDNSVDLQLGLVIGLTANLSHFGVYAAEDGSYLYERGWTSPPAYFSPYSNAYGAVNLMTSRGVLDNSVTTSFGPSLYIAAGQKNGTQLWGGPNVHNFPAGRYVATVWMSVQAQSAGPQVELKVLDHAMNASVVPSTSGSVGGLRYVDKIYESSAAPTTLQSRTVTSTTGPETLEGNFSMDFNWSGYGYLDIAGYSSSPGMDLYLYAITIQQLSAY